MIRFRKLQVFIVVALVAVFSMFLLTPKQSNAQTSVLYGVNSVDDGLSIIDPESGEITFIGPLDPDPNIYSTPVAMAVRPSDGTIFVWNNSDVPLITLTGVLLTVDKCTGLATRVDPDTPNQGEIQALAFGPDNKLYGLGRVTGQTYSLFEIDTETGIRTPIGDSWYGLNVAAADFDGNGILYGVELNNSGNERLVAIDPSAGGYSIIGELSQDIGVIGSIVFDTDGNLVGTSFGGTEGDILFDIDANDGTVSNIRLLSADAPQGMGFAPPCEPEILVPDQINDVIPDTTWECYPSGTFSLYQSFTPQVSPLVAIDLFFSIGSNFPTGGYSTTIRIRSDSISGPILGESTAFIIEDDLPMIRFHFFPEIQVIPGNTYVIEWITPSPEQHIIYWASAYDSYEGGRAYGCEGNPIIPESDFIFITYSTVNTPEGYDIGVQPLLLMPDQVNDAEPGISTSCFDPPYSSLFQTFTPQVSPLAGVDLLLRPALFFPEDGFHTTIKIRSGTIDGDVLGEATTFIPGFPPPAPQELIKAHFDFWPTISVNPGETYVIEWIDAHVEGYPGNILSWIRTEYNSYPGGTMIGCMKIEVPDKDLIFTTYTIDPTAAPVTLNFAEITQAGTTNVSISEEGEQAPFGFKLGEPPTYYEITTTADYTGSIQVCIDYSGVNFEDETQLILYHYENYDWVEVTEFSIDPLMNIICGTVYSLSAFAIMEPVDVEEVEIDIRPFNRNNIIIPWKKGLIPVAILSTDDFSAPDEVERDSLTFGRTGNEESKVFCLRRPWDVNRDGLRDIVCFFRTELGDFQCDDTEGVLRGITKDGTPIEGRDTVIIKCKKGKKIYKKKKRYSWKKK